LICSEAACIGLPLILSDAIGSIGPTDIARPDENTLVFPCRDIAALSAAMERVGEDLALREMMAAKSRSIYDECDVSAAAQGVARALEAVGGRRR
jgi:glycosyltransferase involved in cell wall biosynthesis